MEEIVNFFKDNGFDLFKAEVKFNKNKLELIKILKENNLNYRLLREVFHSPEDINKIIKSINFYKEYYNFEEDFFGLDYSHKMLAFDNELTERMIGWTIK